MNTHKDSRIPVTIITGFLGSGKTSLLQQILRKYHNKKCVIIENEFGKLGVDGHVLESRNALVYEISNGCICCNLFADLVKVLSNLSEQNKYDHVLIETTGIADPLSVVAPFFNNQDVVYKYYVDSVLCVVDSFLFLEQYKEYAELRCQIASSDTVIINKTDLLTHENGIEPIKNCVLQVNPMARVYTTSFANIQDIDVLNTNSYSSASIYSSLNTLSLAPTNITDESLLVVNQKHSYEHDYMSVCFDFSRRFNLERLSFWLRNYLYFNKHTIIRAKGILFFSDMDEPYIFQSVRGTFMFDQDLASSAAQGVSKIVFIGKYIDADDLRENLNSLLEKE